ncbi:MAG: VapB-type antitoxin [Nitrososphaerales archaeon]
MSVISVRVDRKVKEALKKAGINVSKEVKQYLQDLAWRAELRERLEKLNKSLSRITPAQQGFSAKSVREDRESH